MTSSLSLEYNFAVVSECTEKQICADCHNVIEYPPNAHPNFGKAPCMPEMKVLLGQPSSAWKYKCEDGCKYSCPNCGETNVVEHVLGWVDKKECDKCKCVFQPHFVWTGESWEEYKKHYMQMWPWV
jgi:hypothetical protein